MTPTIIAPTGSMLLFSREIVSMEGSWREEKPEQRARQEEIVHMCQEDENPFPRGEICREDGRENEFQAHSPRPEFWSRIRTLTLPPIGQRFTFRVPGCSLAW